MAQRPVLRCKCGHPLKFHGDRAVSICVQFDQPPVGKAPSAWFESPVPMHPMCETCSGWSEDLPRLYLEGLVWACKIPV